MKSGAVVVVLVVVCLLVDAITGLPVTRTRVSKAAEGETSASKLREIQKLAHQLMRSLDFESRNQLAFRQFVYGKRRRSSRSHPKKRPCYIVSTLFPCSLQQR